MFHHARCNYRHNSSLAICSVRFVTANHQYPVRHQTRCCSSDLAGVVGTWTLRIKDEILGSNMPSLIRSQLSRHQSVNNSHWRGQRSWYMQLDWSTERWEEIKHRLTRNITDGSTASLSRANCCSLD